MRSRVTKAMLGVPDNQCVPVMFHEGDIVEGDLAREADAGGWGELIGEDGQPLPRRKRKALLAQAEAEKTADEPVETPVETPVEQPQPVADGEQAGA